MCGFFDRLRGKKKDEPAAAAQEMRPSQGSKGESAGPPPWLRVTTGLRARDKDLYLVVRMVNQGTGVMGESTMEVEVPAKLFSAKDLSRKMPHLEPGQDHKEKFLLKPLYRAGTGIVWGKVAYFDFDVKGLMTFVLPAQKVNLTCPPMKPIETDEDGWRIKTASSSSYDLETVEIKAEPERLYEVVTGAVGPLRMFPVTPQITPGLYRAISRYIGLAGKEIYAFEIQVIGRDRISRMMIKGLGPDDIKARAMAFEVVEALSAKTHIREAIIDPAGEPSR